MYAIGAATGHAVPDLVWQVYLERQRERVIEAVEPAQPILKFTDPLLEAEATHEPYLKLVGRDFDLDGLPDGHDPDDDNDGFPDSLDPAPLNPAIPGAAPALGRTLDIYA